MRIKIKEWKRKRWPQVKKRYAAGCPPRLCRRIRLHDDSARAAYLGACRASTHCSPLLSSRSDLGDRRIVCEPRPTSPRPVLSYARQEHLPGGGLRFPLAPAPTSARAHDRRVDNASIHDRKSLSDLLRQDPRLHRQYLPAYAPQLNPVEAAWQAAKLPLVNGRPEDIYDLGRALLSSLRKTRGSQPTLWGCVLQSELPSVLR